MNPELSDNMDHYKEVSKGAIQTGKEYKAGELTKEEAQETLSDLLRELDSYAEKRTEAFDTTKEAQIEIYKLQLKKQQIMEALRENLRHIDDEDYLGEQFSDSATVGVGQDGGLFVEIENGQTPITPAEIYTDCEWGIRYNIASSQIPREVKKRYFVENAKSELRELLDQQIYQFETGMSIMDDKKRGAYEAVMEERQGELTPGHIIEKIIRNFFKKLEFGSTLNFEIIDTNLYQDIEQKIDFIIHRRNRLRGVATEVDDNMQDIGIQFTTNTDPNVLNRKIEQVERVKRSLGPDGAIEDLTLVKMSPELSQTLYANYKRWRDDPRKLPGGPDKLLPADFKEQLFRNILNGILSPEEVDKQWQEILN